MKILVPVIIASIAAIAATAGAEVCETEPTDWTSPARCQPPNQNRGVVQGGGELGLPSRILGVELTNDVGNSSITAQGRNFFGNLISGCRVVANPGERNTTPEGLCGGGTTHVAAIVFDD